MTYQELYRSWVGFRKGKRASAAIDEFAYNLEPNLMQLVAEINNRSYAPGGYQKVVLQEKKRRDLAVATVRDRVVHRYVYDQLVEIFDRRFDPDVWSCRRGKCLHACLARTQKLLQKHPNSYVWRADITKFYDHVGHEKLQQALSRLAPSAGELGWLCDRVIGSYAVSKQASKQASKQGIPIGNLTSQIFGNIYLNEFDRHVRHKLKPQAYLRYGDDFLLFYSTRQQVINARSAAQKYLASSLGLCLHKYNNVIVRPSTGLHFLGHRIYTNQLCIDSHTATRAINKLSRCNVASYRSLNLSVKLRSQLDYLLEAQIFDI